MGVGGGLEELATDLVERTGLFGVSFGISGGGLLEDILAVEQLFASGG